MTVTVGADMAVELEAGLNDRTNQFVTAHISLLLRDRDRTNQFATQGEKRGTGVCMDVQVLSGNVRWAQTQAHCAHCWQEISP